MLRDITTRWMDNDVYGHVNNVIYYSFFDTAVARYLIRPAYRRCVESGDRSGRRDAVPIFQIDFVSRPRDDWAEGRDPWNVQRSLRDRPVPQRRGDSFGPGPFRPRLRGPGYQSASPPSGSASKALAPLTVPAEIVNALIQEKF